MSTVTICDTCGVRKLESFIPPLEEWAHSVASGTDECPACTKKREDAASAKFWNDARIAFGIPRDIWEQGQNALKDKP